MLNRQIKPLPYTTAITTYASAPYKRRRRVMKMISPLTACLVGAGLALAVIDGHNILDIAIESLEILF